MTLVIHILIININNNITLNSKNNAHNETKQNITGNRSNNNDTNMIVTVIVIMRKELWLVQLMQIKLEKCLISNKQWL